jgi:hypothetical protein
VVGLGVIAFGILPVVVLVELADVSVGVPGKPLPGCFVAIGSFGLSVELQPSIPTHSVTPTLAKTARTPPMRIPCGITFPSPGFLLINRHPCRLMGFSQIVLGHSE